MNNQEITTYSLEDYLKYRSELERTITLTTTERLYNDSFVHAALVLKALIQKAINDNVSKLFMYCGELSLFRDAKANELSNELLRVKPEENAPLYSQWQLFKPYQELIDTLVAFLDKGGKMGLVIDNDIIAIKQEQVWEKLGRFFENGQIDTYKLTSPVGLNHFLVAGESYRRERDQDSKKAVCCFNNKDTSTILKNSYYLLRLVSEPYKFD